MVSAEPRLPSESTTSTRKWTFGGQLGGKIQVYWPVFSMGAVRIGDHCPSGVSGLTEIITDREAG